MLYVLFIRPSLDQVDLPALNSEHLMNRFLSELVSVKYPKIVIYF